MTYRKKTYNKRISNILRIGSYQIINLKFISGTTFIIIASWCFTDNTKYNLFYAVLYYLCIKIFSKHSLLFCPFDNEKPNIDVDTYLYTYNYLYDYNYGYSKLQYIIFPKITWNLLRLFAISDQKWNNFYIQIKAHLSLSR